MTARAIQYRRGTTAEHSSFTGLNGEITVNTDKKVVIVHDEQTAGGFEMARADMNNVSQASLLAKIGNINLDTSNLADIDLSNLSTTGQAVIDAKLNKYTSGTISATNPAYIVETYSSGTLWYRKWSDGWIEQGGYVSGTSQNYIITLLTVFSDSNYVISGIADNYTGISGSCLMIDQGSQTSTGFTIVVNYLRSEAPNKKIRWYACGY